mgnify:CR=1 FL=1
MRNQKVNKSNFFKICLIVIATILLAGCSNSEENNQSSNNFINSGISTEDTSNMQKLNCTREANAGAGIDVDLNYEVYYQGEYIKILHSMESVTTENQETLDEYETAYKNIAKNYEGLKYYDQTVTRTNNKVNNDTVINYGKIDTNKLLEIEGEEDNIIKDGKVKLDDWLNFAKKFGTKCE